MSGDQGEWEFFRDKAKEWRWRRMAGEDIVGAATEGYKRKRDCVANAQRHGYQGNPDQLGQNDHWEFYQDKAGAWRWRRTATNGEIVGASKVGYANKYDCLANAAQNAWNRPSGVLRIYGMRPAT